MLRTARRDTSAEDKRTQPSEVSLEEDVRGEGEETEPEQGNSEQRNLGDWAGGGGATNSETTLSGLTLSVNLRSNELIAKQVHQM